MIKLKWHKGTKASTWNGFYKDKHVATVTTGWDDTYPWDWYFMMGVENIKLPKQTSGLANTLKEAKQHIAEILNEANK